MGHGGIRDNTEYLQTADGTGFNVKKKIAEIFDNNIFPHLKDKPKIFIIQACRGGYFIHYMYLPHNIYGFEHLLNLSNSFLQGENTKHQRQIAFKLGVLVTSQITLLDSPHNLVSCIFNYKYIVFCL